MTVTHNHHDAVGATSRAVGATSPMAGPVRSLPNGLAASKSVDG